MEARNHFCHLTVDNPHDAEFGQQMTVAILKQKSGAFIPSH
jgi:hypothetical protein